MTLEEWVTYQIGLGKSIEKLYASVDWVRIVCNIDHLREIQFRTFYGTLGLDVPTDILVVGNSIVVNGRIVRIEENMDVKWLVKMDIMYEDVEYVLSLLKKMDEL